MFKALYPTIRITKTLKPVFSAEVLIIPPTGKSTEAGYVYVMEFDGDKIRHMTKIWHTGWTMKELGWAIRDRRKNDLAQSYLTGSSKLEPMNLYLDDSVIFCYGIDLPPKIRFSFRGSWRAFRLR